MSSRRYTEHRLTSHQVKQLSQYVNGRREGPSGTAAEPVIRAGLAERIEAKHFFPIYTISREAAGELVAQARREGW